LFGQYVVCRADGRTAGAGLNCLPLRARRQNGSKAGPLSRPRNFQPAVKGEDPFIMVP